MQVVNDEITSPLSAQIFDFCDPKLFQEPFQTSEVTSASNYCGYDENPLFSNNLLEKSRSFNENDGSNTNTNTTTTTTTTPATDNNIFNDDDDNADLSIIFDSQEDFDNDITASIDFSSSLQFPVSDHFLGTSCQYQFDFSSVSVPQQTPNVFHSASGDPSALTMASSSMTPRLLQSSGFEEDCLSSIPSYNVGLNPSSSSCSFLGTPGLPTYMAVGRSLNHSLSSESSGFYSGSIHMSSDLKPHDPLIDYQADNGGIFGTDSIKRIFNPGDLQVIGGGENQTHLVTTAGGPPLPPHLGAEISGLDDATFNKVGKLSVEQRKEKIHRYMKKRNQRNFSKKIKYACRKTLADSRPRVRGRFAKNDEFGEANRQASSSHHDDDDDDDVGVKEEEQMVDSSDIFSHISGVNSFKCNYPIQSWI